MADAREADRARIQAGMTLAEATQVLAVPSVGCACLGPPGCCVDVFAVASRVKTGAQQVANHFAAALSRGDIDG